MQNIMQIGEPIPELDIIAVILYLNRKNELVSKHSIHGIHSSSAKNQDRMAEDTNGSIQTVEY